MAVISAVAPSAYRLINVLWGRAEMDVFRSGIGFHDVKIDVSALVLDVPDALLSVDAYIYNDDLAELVGTYTGSAPLLTAENTSVTTGQLFTEVYTTPSCIDEDRTYFKFRHAFDHGDYRISLRVNYGSNGEWFSATESIIIKAGDGFMRAC